MFQRTWDLVSKQIWTYIATTDTILILSINTAKHKHWLVHNKEAPQVNSLLLPQPHCSLHKYCSARDTILLPQQRIYCQHWYLHKFNCMFTLHFLILFLACNQLKESGFLWNRWPRLLSIYSWEFEIKHHLKAKINSFMELVLGYDAFNSHISQESGLSAPNTGLI